MHNNLIVDINNLVFSLRYAKLSQTKKERFAKETLFKESLKTIINYSKKLKADSLVLCVDSPNVWRKDIYENYKANRIEAVEDIHYKDVIDASDLLLNFFSNFTASFVLKVPRAEADDIIAVWCQESEGVQNTILSTDTDFVQLLNDRTRLYSHVQDKFRESEDPMYSLFVKCIRGDRNDFIRSAYPRIHETKLKKAWEDDIEMLNLLETIRPDGVKVGEAFSLNMNLIDLGMQPPQVRDLIVNKILNYTPMNFKQISAMRFFGENGLKDSVDILDVTSNILKNKPIFKMTK